MDKYINDIEITAQTFAWDGCHKIYLCESDADIQHMKHRGYEDGDFYPIDRLPEIWDKSCGLRFISSADLETQYVPQCEDAYFEGFGVETFRRAVFIDTARDAYSPNDITGTRTIRQLIEQLRELGDYLGDDTPVFLRNDGGYTYGCITDYCIDEGGFNEETVLHGYSETSRARRDGAIFVS